MKKRSEKEKRLGCVVVIFIVIFAMPPMRGVLLETGNISETIVAKMVIVSIIATPENHPL